MAAQRPALPLPMIRMSVSVGTMLDGGDWSVDVGGLYLPGHCEGGVGIYHE